VLVEPADEIAEKNEACGLNEVEPVKIENQLWRPTVRAGRNDGIRKLRANFESVAPSKCRGMSMHGMAAAGEPLIGVSAGWPCTPEV